MIFKFRKRYTQKLVQNERPLDEYPEDSVEYKVGKIISTLKTTERIYPSSSLSSLGLDSLDIVELILALEEEFLINIPDEAENFKTVGEFISYLYRRV